MSSFAQDRTALGLARIEAFYFAHHLFLPPEDYRREVAHRIETIKATPRQTGVNEIRIPGERGYRDRARLLRDGIEIDLKIHTALGRLALGKPGHGG